MWHRDGPTFVTDNVWVGISFDGTKLWQASFVHFAVGDLGSHMAARDGGGGGAGEKAEILRLEAENKLLREQLKAAEAARKTAQEALNGERAAWERREKGCEKQRAELQQQLSATAQVRAVGGGGGGRGWRRPRACAVPASRGG